MILTNVYDVRDAPDDDVDALVDSSRTHCHIGGDSSNYVDNNSTDIPGRNMGNNTFYRTQAALLEFGY